MKPETGKPAEKMISTPTIVILVAAVGLLGYLFMQPMLSPNSANSVSSNPPSAVGAIAATQQDLVVQQGQSSAAKETAGAINISAAQEEPAAVMEYGNPSVRDPFLPSALALAARAAQATQQTDSNPLPSFPVDASESQSETTQTGISVNTPEPKATPKPDEIVWRGVMGDDGAQLALIQRNNRNYNLYIGDVLPGTRYILSEINQDSILLISPSDQKLLYKKKEAK